MIDEARLLLATVAVLPAARGADPAACNATMVRLRDELGAFQSLGVIDRDGTIVCSALQEARGISVADLNKQLALQHVAISNGYGTLKEKTFRIAHMGDTQEWEIRGLLQTIDRILGH